MAGTQVVTWQEEMAKAAAAAAATEQPSGNFISLKGGLIAISGQPIPNNVLQGVVIDWCHERSYYSQAFDSSNIVAPDCFALARDQDPEGPHPSVTEKQSLTCRDCDMNQWGSSPSGSKGKACREMRRLALLSLADVQKGPEAILSAQVYFMRVPVMSIGNWQAHDNVCNAVARMPPWAVLSEITCKPDPKSMFKVLFQFKGALNEEQVSAIVQKRALLGDAGMMFVPSVPEKGEDKPKPSAAQTAARRENAKFKRPSK
jgi:hypothetical protein